MQTLRGPQGFPTDYLVLFKDASNAEGMQPCQAPAVVRTAKRTSLRGTWGAGGGAQAWALASWGASALLRLLLMKLAVAFVAEEDFFINMMMLVQMLVVMHSSKEPT